MFCQKIRIYFSIRSKMAFISAISRSCDSIMRCDSAFTSGSRISACLLVRMADEWCGIIAFMYCTSFTGVCVRKSSRAVINIATPAEPMARLWPQVAAAAHAWPGTVIADLGRLQLRHASSPVAAASTTVLLLTRAGTGEDLFHVRQRAHELAGRLGQGPHGRSPLVVAVVAPSRTARARVAQVQQALAAQATTSTVPVAGFIAHDEKSAEALRDGVVTKRLLGSDLLKSAKELAQTLTGWFPEVAGFPIPPIAPATEAGRHQPGGGDSHAWRQPMTPVEQYQAQARWGAATGPSAGGGSK